MTSRVQFLGLVLIVVLFGFSAAPALAQSQGDTQPAATRLTISPPATAGAKGHLTLNATLTTSDGKAVSGQQISFYQQTDVFGQRDALLGTATTDSSGYAAIDYQPAEAGSQIITARFAGGPQSAATDVSRTIQIRDVIAPYAQQALPLAVVREWLPLGLASLVLGTWAVLIGVSLRTVRGVRAAASTVRQDPNSVFAFAPEAFEGRDS